MLARTPPERRPLPTARFLATDRRTRLRLRPPTDLLLLALRASFLLLLGAAFADPEWLPDREGGSVVVLLDGGEDMGPVWDQAIAAVSDRLGDDGILVVFDTTARRISDPATALDSLRANGPAAARSDYLAALRGLRKAALALPAESASAVLVTRPRWGAWSPGITTAREAAWRGRIDVVAVAPTDGGIPGSAEGESPGGRAEPPREGGGQAGEGPGSALVFGPEEHPLRPYVIAALQVLGYDRGPSEETALIVVLPGQDADASFPGGVRVVVLGGAPGAAGLEVPWRTLGEAVGEAPDAAPDAMSGEASEGPRLSRGRLVLPGGYGLGGWLPRNGDAPDGAVVVAVWEDGRPAATATRAGEACVAYLAADPVHPGAAADPAFPHLVRELARACDPASGAAGSADAALADAALADADLADAALRDVPLDAGALSILRGDALPAAADLLSLDGGHGRSLVRLLFALALLVALAEAGLAYGRRVAR